jgi:hypothetical protein
MPDSGFADDDWNDLYRELDVGKSPAPQNEAHTPDPELPHGDDDKPAYNEDAGPLYDDGESGADEGEAEAEGAEGEPAGEGAPGEEQPGTGRKRRRRRRRRKKGGGPEAGGEAGEAAATEEADEPVAEYGVAVRSGGEGEAGEEELAIAEHEEGGDGAALAAEEDTGGEVLRDLIATWNVPSWDEIVTGLYRPER